MEDKHLIKECLKGKPEAQKLLYERYAPYMLGVSYRYTKNMGDAENILQDAFVKVFNHLEDYDSRGELGAWIRKIVVNTALTYLKSNKKYSYELVYPDDNLHLVSDENPELKMNAKELASFIRQLPTGYQTVFNLYAVEGYSHVEIAGMLGISDGTSRSQYARARSLLIGWIEKYSLNEKGSSYGKQGF